MVNFLSLLGWNPGTEKEVFSLSELIESFSLERVNKSGARFDPEKTKWYNHQYLQAKSDKELTDLFISQNSSRLEDKEHDYIEKVVSLIKERANFVVDLWDLGSYFFEAPTEFNEKAAKKQIKEDTPQILKQVAEIIENVSEFSSQNIENAIKVWIGEKELSFGKVMGPLRLSIVGDLKGPHLFDIIAMIGKEDTITRIDNAISKLS